jgi:Protein of unknown function (DUF2793)
LSDFLRKFFPHIQNARNISAANFCCGDEMETTGRLELPLITPSQAQKHVTHNEALTLLDGIVHLVVTASGLLAPPVGAPINAVYLTGSPASGAWVGEENRLALNTDAGWRFAAPVRGMIGLFIADNSVRIFDGGNWTPIGSYLGALNPSQLGVNTSADAINKLAVRSNAALFTALNAGDGGNGDLQIKLNKEAAGDTASLIYQNGFSGRAEIGLAGDDNLSFKVSPNGSAWQTAITIDRTTAQVTLADNSIGNAALADMPTARIKGRTSAGTGDPQDLTGPQATALLDTFTSSAKGLAPASGGGTANFLRADGSWAAPAGGGGASLSQTTLDFGTAPVFAKTFTFAHAGAAIGQKVMMSAAGDMAGGLPPDELETDELSASARVVSMGTIAVTAIANPGPVSGQRNFNYIIA